MVADQISEERAHLGRLGAITDSREAKAIYFAAGALLSVLAAFVDAWASHDAA